MKEAGYNSKGVIPGYMGYVPKTVTEPTVDKSECKSPPKRIPGMIIVLYNA